MIRTIFFSLGAVLALFLWQVYAAWEITSDSKLCGESLADRSIPIELAAAVLQQEDQAFFKHAGVDWTSLKYAVIENIKARKVLYGASTIDMQVASICFLKTKGLNRWVEKLREILIVQFFFSRFTKSQIFEAYLSGAPMGEGLVGFQSAARHYFNRELSELSREELWSLVLTLKSDRLYNPHQTEINKKLPRLEWLKLQKAKYKSKATLSFLKKDLKALSYIGLTD